MGRIVYTDPSGQEFSVVLSAEAPVVTIGRATDCSIRSNRKSVSRHHAEFRYSNGRFEVVDLDSANGTYLIINNERRPVHGRQFISHGDEVWCGDFILHFYEDQTQASAPSHFGVPGGRSATGGQPSMNSGFGANYEYAEHDMGAHGSEFGNFSANYEADALSYGEYEELLEDEFSEVQEGGSGNHGDLERLRAEKRSIEELAAKQAFEVVELRIQISERDQKIEQLSQSVSMLEAAQGDQAELKKAGARAAELEKKLDDALTQIQQLEALPKATGADPAELAELRDAVSAKELNLNELQSKLDETISQLDAAVKRAAKAEKAEHSATSALEELRQSSATGAAQEVEGLKNELERQGRLMTQFERRSRELQLELDHERAIAKSLRDMAASHETLVDELAVVTRERDDAIVNYSRLNEEITKVESNAEQAKNSVRDLKSEIQGLKRLLQMERERSREDKALAEENAGLEQQIAMLSQELKDLQTSYQQQEVELQKSLQELQIATLAAGISPKYFEDMREQIDTLERIVDALERTDLQPLTTVDRIRLQSAIRDSAPRAILQEMRRMTTEIVEKEENS